QQSSRRDDVGRVDLLRSLEGSPPPPSLSGLRRMAADSLQPFLQSGRDTRAVRYLPVRRTPARARSSLSRTPPQLRPPHVRRPELRSARASARSPSSPPAGFDWPQRRDST